MNIHITQFLDQRFLSVLLLNIYITRITCKQTLRLIITQEKALIPDRTYLVILPVLLLLLNSMKMIMKKQIIRERLPLVALQVSCLLEMI